MKNRFFILLGLLIAAGVTYYFFSSNNKQETTYLTESVTRGNIEKTVVASGSVESVNEVDVGAQASGKNHQALCQVRARNQKRRNDR